MKPVLIEWIDSKSISNRWEYVDELPSTKPSRCVSLGFLLKENKEYKTIVQSCGAQTVMGIMTIPNCCILKITKLK
jgi:hypothetical protein